MNRMLALLLVSAALPHPASLSAADVEATTSDGRKVILRDDGTWVLQSAPTAATRGLTSKPAGATEVIQSKKGFMELWYDPSKWTPRTKFNNESAEFALEHTAGDAFAMAIVERIGMPFATLRRVALDNAKSTAPDARITLEEEREVNGTRLVALQIDGTFSGIPFRYYGYYWTGGAGTFQVVTFTAQNLFDEMSRDFTDLLNGIVVTRN